MALHPAAPCLLALVAVLHVAPGAGQTISGRVIDASGQPLEAVHLALVDPAEARGAEAFSDSAGEFRLVAPRPGAWRVTAELIGFAKLRSEPLRIQRSEEVEVEIRMAVAAVPLDPLVVTDRMRRSTPDIEAFYDRMERGRRFGVGRFVDREEIDRLGPIQATDLLRGVAGVRLVDAGPARGRIIRMSGNCTPAVYIDGVLINRTYAGDSLDDYVAATSIEGIEVYRGAASSIGRFYDPRGCGLVLVWTRRGENNGQPLSWPRLLIGLSALALILLLIAR